MGSFLCYPHHCGIVDNIFNALFKKNMGCSHVIIEEEKNNKWVPCCLSDYKKLIHEN